MAAAAATVAARRLVTPSFGFSGAGFLTCYHLGVADCLLKHGLLFSKEKNNNVLLTGVSGGALVAATVSMGIPPEEGMTATLEIARRTRQAGGMLDHLLPGYSLVDQVEEFLLLLTRNLDEEEVLRRIDNGRLLRIGLTDSGAFPNVRNRQSAYLYVDHYESVEEIISACTLSSFVPGLTGPATPFGFNNVNTNTAVRRATDQLQAMLQRGAVKDITGGRPVYQLARSNSQFWDGGLSDPFPVVDSNTCIVTPFCGTFGKNPSISPSSTTKEEEQPPQSIMTKEEQQQSTMDIHDRVVVQLDVSLQNLQTIRCIAFSSPDELLQSRYEQGYNDANRYLTRQNHHSSVKSIQHPAAMSLPSSTSTTTDTVA